ncbi:DNA-binding protein WhiA [Actinomyces sp. S4-C9]|uniref:DNA-binding protein WhiA n=1 Tax=Actinomyces sp. S4-C9 TaxID=1219581 RepID=UPI0005107981|nr:DNA-binding protein WhiA [Actinomyces sp. S4-C9]KGF02068.1 sporulation protein [Actinomyces sp. S4-C9]
MSLTLALKEELVKKPVATPSEMVAEVGSMLRFAGGLHLVSGRVIIEAEVDLPATAARLRTFMAKLFKVNSSVVIVSGGALKKGDRYVVRVVERADHLARMTGLIDAQGRPVRGLPTRIVASGDAEAIAAWRGAFLARGSLMEPGRSSAMEITAPGPEAALAMAGFARRMGAQAKVREIRSAQRVVVREADGIASILQALETPETLQVWQARRKRRVARGSANRLANFDDANLRRSARAAVVASARVKRAFDILGDEVPEHLREAGELRVSHPQASLEELGKLANPQLTKDAIAGRIRRLLAMADKRAHEDGLPDTEASLSADLLEG